MKPTMRYLMKVSNSVNTQWLGFIKSQAIYIWSWIKCNFSKVLDFHLMKYASYKKLTYVQNFIVDFFCHFLVKHFQFSSKTKTMFYCPKTLNILEMQYIYEYYHLTVKIFYKIRGSIWRKYGLYICIYLKNYPELYHLSTYI